MRDDDELAAARGKHAQEWRERLGAIPASKGGVMVARNYFNQIELAKVYGSGTFLKDVTGLPGVPARPENGPLVMAGALYRDKAVYTAVGVTDQNPMPNLFWGTTLSVVVSEVAVGNVDQAVAVPAGQQRYAKTVSVKGDPANAQVVYVKGDGTPITAGPPIQGYPIGPGDVQVFPVKDLTNIHIYSTNAANRIAILYVPDTDHT
jgi:hypothetical protein